MTTLFDVDNSSDSDDCDYEPPTGEISSDDEEPIPLSDDEKEIKKKASKRQKSKNSLTLETEHEISDGNKAISNTVDEKKKAEDVYKSFLDEVATEMKEAKNESMSSGISCSESTTSSPIVQNIDKNSCQSSSGNTPEKLSELTKKTISESSTVASLNSEGTCSSDSKEVKSASSTAPGTPVTVKRKGLDSILGNILNKKQKMTTLTKSMLDWKSFKEEEGIEEELATYNRGKGGFIERKRFLERSDVRSYEIERDLRMTKRQPKKNI